MKAIQASTITLLLMSHSTWATLTSQQIYEHNERSKTIQQSSSEDRSIKQLEQGQGRARELVDILWQKELKTVGDKAANRGQEILKEDADLKTQATVIGAGAALWFGHSIHLIKQAALNLKTRVEGRARSGSIEIDSLPVNGRVQVSGSNGSNFSLSRNLYFINGQAEVLYGLRDQSISSKITHPITRHLEISVGTLSSSVRRSVEGNACLTYATEF